MYSDKKVFTDEQLIQMIKNAEEAALDYIYKRNYVMIVSMILKRGGTEEQAKDIFQDCLIVFWQKVICGEFVLRAKISTFLYSVCLNLWKKEFNRNLKFSNNDVQAKNNFVSIKDDLHEQDDIIQEAISELGESCKKVLQYFYFDGRSLKEICEILKFANINTTKTKKYKCKKKLDAIIRTKYNSEDFLD